MLHVLLFLLATSSDVKADILKCENAAGVVYFSDRTCDTVDTATYLPFASKPLSVKDLQRIERDVRKSRNAIHQQALKQQKQKLVDERRAAQDQKRRLRKRLKCETLGRQIVEVNNKYKEGYTVKQGIALDRKLTKYKEQKKRYCTNE